MAETLDVIIKREFNRLDVRLNELINYLKVTNKGLTDAELRKTAVPVSGTVTIDSTGLSTEAKQDDIITAIGTIPAGGDATAANQVSEIALLTTIDTDTGNIKTNTDSVVTPTAIYTGKTTVTTAGTQVALASSQTIKSVTIKALSTNTGFIYVGNSGVDSTNGFQLSAGDTVSLDLTNLSTVYIDSSVNGEGVTYLGNG